MFESISNNEIIGLMAAFCTTYSFIPQVYKTWKTKDVEGLSLTMYSVFLLGVIFWLVFGLLINSISVILANSITCASVMILIFFKLKYRKS